MSRKKQIEPVKEIKEIADIIHREDGPLVVLFYNDSLTLAEKLYNAGYRKASDVAREIFEEIEKVANLLLNDIDYSGGDFVRDISELKKKYTNQN